MARSVGRISHVKLSFTRGRAWDDTLYFHLHAARKGGQGTTNDEDRRVSQNDASDKSIGEIW
jgi:hypothetical protein